MFLRILRIFDPPSHLSLYSYFVAYEAVKKLLTPAGASPGDLNLGTIILAGGSAGVAMWAIAIPPDVCLY